MIEILTRFTILLLYRLIAPTWRIVEEGGEVEEPIGAILAGAEPASILFAHGKMFPMWYHLRHTGGVPVTSRSRDGDRLAWVLRRGLGYDRIIRGSSSSGGREVLGELVGALSERSTIVTPDGPRGPRNEPKVGGIVAASRSRRTILVVTWRAMRSIRLDTWDRMEIPIPFSKVYIRYCTLKSPIPDRIEATTRAIAEFLREDQDYLPKP